MILKILPFFSCWYTGLGFGWIMWPFELCSWLFRILGASRISLFLVGHSFNHTLGQRLRKVFVLRCQLSSIRSSESYWSRWLLLRGIWPERVLLHLYISRFSILNFYHQLLSWWQLLIIEFCIVSVLGYFCSLSTWLCLPLYGR
jgi:hypothetical protein